MDWERQQAGSSVWPGIPECADERGPLAIKEPEIPHRVNRLFNDLHELRESVLFLSGKLDSVMSVGGPKQGHPEKVSQDPNTGLGAQIAEMSGIVNFTREVVADMIDRLEL